MAFEFGASAKTMFTTKSRRLVHGEIHGVLLFQFAGDLKLFE